MLEQVKFYNLIACQTNFDSLSMLIIYAFIQKHFRNEMLVAGTIYHLGSETDCVYSYSAKIHKAPFKLLVN